MKYISAKRNNYEFEFKKVTVILGANGSGKSDLLRSIRDSFKPDKQPTIEGPFGQQGVDSRRVVYVEGGRAITINDNLGLVRPDAGAPPMQRRQMAMRETRDYRSRRGNNLGARLAEALKLLALEDDYLTIAHGVAVHQWHLAGQVGKPPTRDPELKETLFAWFNEVFPHLHLQFEKDRFYVKSDWGHERYGLSALSDGEKQALSLLADLLQIETDISAVIVDEPELNLHPELAERLWTFFEHTYPDKHFIYATHSILFALRSTVDSLYVLSLDSKQTIRLTDLRDLSKIELGRFLGSAPGILWANRVVVVEGDDDSFDAIFYRWLLGDDNVKIFPGGGCSEVMRVVEKNGVWSRISSSVVLVGIIDYDFGSGPVSSDGLITLELHEAESFICIPAVVVAAAKLVGAKDPLPKVEEIESIIFKELSSQALQIACRRVFAQSAYNAKLALGKGILNKLTSRAQVMLAMRKHLDEVKSGTGLDPDAFDRNLARVESEIVKLIQDRDWRTALNYLPGKELAHRISKLTGLESPEAVMRVVKKHLRADDFPLTKALRGQILNRLEHPIGSEPDGLGKGT